MTQKQTVFPLWYLRSDSEPQSWQMKGFYQLHQLSLHHRRCRREGDKQQLSTRLNEKVSLQQNRGKNRNEKRFRNLALQLPKTGEYICRPGCLLTCVKWSSQPRKNATIKQATLKINFVVFTNEFSKHQWAERKVLWGYTFKCNTSEVQMMICFLLLLQWDASTFNAANIRKQ